MKGSQHLLDQIMAGIYTTSLLKAVSEELEDLSQDKKFKLHAASIVEDDTLSPAQRSRQMTYLLKTVENDYLRAFLFQCSKDAAWLFTQDKLDYFDSFVRQFQMQTEEMEVIFLETAIELEEKEYVKIVDDLSKAFKYRVILNHVVTPSVLGGARVRVENLVFDYSLSTKFSQFERAWVASLDRVEKHVGRNQP